MASAHLGLDGARPHETVDDLAAAGSSACLVISSLLDFQDALKPGRSRSSSLVIGMLTAPTQDIGLAVAHERTEKQAVGACRTRKACGWRCVWTVPLRSTFDCTNWLLRVLEQAMYEYEHPCFSPPQGAPAPPEPAPAPPLFQLQIQPSCRGNQHKKPHCCKFLVLCPATSC